MFPIKITKKTGQAIGAIVGVTWVIICLAVTLYGLEKLLAANFQWYAACLPLLLAACIASGFVGNHYFGVLLNKIFKVKRNG